MTKRVKLPVIRAGQKPTLIKIAEDLDIYELFAVIEQRFDTCFLLESLGGFGSESRYSVIGFDPDHIIRAREQQLFVDDEAYNTDNPFYALRDMLPQKSISRLFAGGLTGYMGYDAAQYIEPSLAIKPHPDFDAFMFGAYTDGLILDTQTAELSYFYHHTNRSDLVRELLAAKLPKLTCETESLGDTLTKEEHAANVNFVKEHILAGDIFQCEVGFKTEYRVTGDALHIYGRLRQVNPSPCMYYLKFGNKKLFGSSPELQIGLVSGFLTTRIVAGTTGRGDNETEDRKLARRLLNDPKEIAEHNMLVDLHRNDLGRVAQFGSVRVSDLKSIRRFSHVQHIGSEITGSIRPDEDMFSAFAATFPGGTLTGAPKIEAMKIIESVEQQPRGPYGGAVGHFGFNGDCRFAMILRSLFVSDERAYAQTCGGIVYDSVVQNEYLEIKRKLAAMDKAVMQ